MKLDIPKFDAAGFVTLAGALLAFAGYFIESKQRAVNNHEIAVEVAEILSEKLNERNDA